MCKGVNNYYVKMDNINPDEFTNEIIKNLESGKYISS